MDRLRRHEIQKLIDIVSSTEETPERNILLEKLGGYKSLEARIEDIASDGKHSLGSCGKETLKQMLYYHTALYHEAMGYDTPEEREQRVRERITGMSNKEV